MAGERFCRVQFVGGPFDGHVQLVRLPPASLAKVATLPVSREILQMLGTSDTASESSATSEALYRLEASAGQPRYRFIKSIAPIQTQ